MEILILVIVTLILSYFTLVFEELVPKRIGMNYPNKLSFMLVNTLNMLIRIFYPLVWLLTTSTNFVWKLLWIKNKDEYPISEAELRKIIINAKEDYSIKPTEQKMIMKVFNFDDIRVSKVMKRFNDVIMIDSNMDFEETQNVVKEHQFTRCPVY